MTPGYLSIAAVAVCVAAGAVAYHDLGTTPVVARPPAAVIAKVLRT